MADASGIGTIFGSIIDGIFGIGSQEREFDQQNALTDKQNEWNSAQQQMQRAKEAGINPLTAAAGISGGGTNAAAPAGGSALPMNMAGAMSDALRIPSETEKNRAAAEKDFSEARNKDRLTDSEILVNASAAAKNLVVCGIPEIRSMELGLQFARTGLNGFSNAFNADGLCRAYDQERDYYDSLINSENQRFADLQAQTRLHGSLADLTAQQKEHESILTEIDKQKRDIRNKYQSACAENDTLAQFLLVDDFGVDSKEYQGYMNFTKDRFYNQSIGGFNADMDTAFNRSYNAAKAKADVDAEFRPYFDFLDELKTLYETIVKSDLENPQSIKAIFGKLSNLMSNPAYKKYFDNTNAHIDRSKPIPGNASLSSQFRQ